MQNPWPANYKTDTWSTRQVPIRARRIAGRLFIPKANELDPQIDGFLGDLDDRYPHNAEDDRDTEVSEAARDYARTSRGRHGV